MPASQRYFALFGAKGTGKTAYLASLYTSSGNPADGGQTYHVAASEEPDDPTHTYLGRIGRALKAGRWPDSSPFERLTELKIRFTIGDLERSLVLPDVGGELTKRDEQVQIELKKEVLAHYQDYQGFLIFIPADLTDPEQAAESKWEVDVLLNALRERVPEGRTKIARPIAVLVTKWDLIEPGPVTDASEQRAVAFFETVHPDQSAGFGTLCENLRIFPVSATGPLVAGQPPVPLQPTNLGEPIAWLIETAERVMLERAVAYADENDSRLFKRAPGDARRRTHLKIALERLKHFQEDISSGPMADEARAEIERLNVVARRHSKKIVVNWAIVFSSVVLMVIGCHDYMVYRETQERLGGSSRESYSREVVARVESVIRRPIWQHPVGYGLTWWHDLRRGLEAYRTGFEKRRFEEITEVTGAIEKDDHRMAQIILDKIGAYEVDFPDSARLAELNRSRERASDVIQGVEERRRIAEIDADYGQWRSHPEDPRLASTLLERCDLFHNALPASIHDSKVQAIRAEVQVVVNTRTRAKNHEELRVQCARVSESPWRCYQLCTEFLKNDPSHPMAKEVAADRDRYLHKADEKAWDEVIGFARTLPSRFPEQIARCEEYMHNVLFTAHQVEASDFKNRANRGFDRASYEAIRTKAGDKVNPATLSAMRKLGAEYLNAPIPGKKMTTEIERWAKWFDGWGEGQEFKVRVVSVRIDRDSAWHYRTWPSDPWVHASVRVGQKTCSTGDKYIPLGRDVLEVPDDLLGPFTWKWGGPDVAISLTYKDANPQEFPTNFAEADPFQVRHLNGRATFDNGKIAVLLECPAVVPPSLPPYKD